MPQNQKKSIWIISFLFIAFIIGMMFLGIKFTANHTAVAPENSNIIGGGFQLISPAGSIVNDGIFRGKWMLMYFGATRCPHNQCRKDLIKMGEIINHLENKASQLVPIFISFDSNYDTPSRLMLSMKTYNDKIIALTGGELALRDISILYHVSIKKAPINSDISLVEPYDQFILMDPEGKYRTSIQTGTETHQIVETLESIIH
ncbi:SCO family protein [Commensalibacter melissae]|uniref:SCO family protein n=1 Tax=Commensalibacter melissae TaxID=2070537 RepID=UPI000EFD62B6|nr:SCO family protein [Commensalibacter melissae]AYN86083.1 SCO family protein [Commensalibacter melissae]